MQDRKKIIEFIRFALVGILATGLHYGIYYLLQIYISINVAYTIGYIMSFLANFYLTSYFTFGASPSWGRLLGMGGAHVVNYLLHLLLLNIFVGLGVSPVWAPLPVFSIAVPVNFILVRWVFTHKKR